MLRALNDAALYGRPAFNRDVYEIPAEVFEKESRTAKSSFKFAVDLREGFKAYSSALAATISTTDVPEALQGESMLACEALLEQLAAVKTKIRGQNEGEGEETAEEIEFCRAFYIADGWIPALEFLQIIAIPFMKEAPQGDARQRDVGDVAIFCLILLKDLCFSIPELASSLGNRDELICSLIQALTIPPLYEFIAVFCETILNARRGPVFEMRKIKDLEDLIGSFNACQLVCFCRIVSCVTTDPAERLGIDGRHLESFDLLDERRRMAIGEVLGNDLVAGNHSLLVSTSKDLIPRIIQLLGNMDTPEAERRLWLSRRNNYWRLTSGIEEEETLVDGPIERTTERTSPKLDTGVPYSSLGHRFLAAGLACIRAFFRMLSRREASALGTAVKGFLRATWSFLTRRLIGGSSRNHIDTAQQQRLIEEDDVELNDGQEDDNIEENAANNGAPDAEEADFTMSSAFWSHPTARDLWQITQRLDIACLLNALCVGPCKRLVQDMLTRCGLIAALIQRFDSLSWDPNCDTRDLPVSARVHGVGCECDPHGAFKGQLLRLVHNFCDREAENRQNKAQLFTKEELNGLFWDYRQLEMGERPPFGWQPISIRFRPPLVRQMSPSISDEEWRRMKERDAEKRLSEVGLPNGGCPPEHGLAWRIAAVLNGADQAVSGGDATLHFWVYAALEALLRGSNVELKMMVCSWGVLRAVVTSLLKQSTLEGTPRLDDLEAPEDLNAGYLQTSYDLLGELIKDNPDALGWICNAPCNVLGPTLGEHVLTHICTVAMNHLVDGNVFLRALGLTLPRNPRNVKLSPARNWFDENVIRASFGLWTVVGISNVSQENLCCLNTAVVLLTFARMENRLHTFIESVVKFDVMSNSSCSAAFLQQMNLRQIDTPEVRFRKLLWFWRCYYSCRASDRKSLEHSSGIKFAELESTVRTLCDRSEPDGSSILTGLQTVHIPYKGTTVAVLCPLELEPWDAM